MLGSICGDIIGSRFESFDIKEIDPGFALFTRKNRFTDDTVLTVAIAHAILTDKDYEKYIRMYYRKYPKAGYGGMFREWAKVEFSPAYNSFGNGSAMRVCPVAYAFDTIQDVEREAKQSSEVTHNHPEGIKGAQAVAHAVFLALKGYTKEYIKTDIEERYGYILNDVLNAHHVGFDTTCQGSVPQALVAFLESDSFEDSMRRAVAMGGDVDTICCMTGSISEAYYGLPARIHNSIYKYLPSDLVEIIVRFERQYINPFYSKPNVAMSIGAQVRDTFQSIFCK